MSVAAANRDDWPLVCAVAKAFGCAATAVFEEVTPTGAFRASTELQSLDVAVGGPALFEIALVVLLGGPEWARGSDLRGDGMAELAASVQRLLGFFRGGFLFR